MVRVCHEPRTNSWFNFVTWGKIITHTHTHTHNGDWMVDRLHACINSLYIRRKRISPKLGSGARGENNK